ENAALGFNHLKSHFVKRGKVGAHAIGGNETIITAIIGFADGGVDADLGGHAGDDELLDAAILEDRMEVGGEECAFAGLVDDGFAGQRVDFGDDVVSSLPAHEDAAHGAGVTDAGLAAAADFLGG